METLRFLPAIVSGPPLGPRAVRLQEAGFGGGRGGGHGEKNEAGEKNVVGSSHDHLSLDDAERYSFRSMVSKSSITIYRYCSQKFAHFDEAFEQIFFNERK